MADNVTIVAGANSTPQSGTEIAADEVGGVKYQRVKLVLGADGAVDGDVDSGQQVMADSVPVVIASDQTDLPITLNGEQVDVSDRAARDLGKVDVANIDSIAGVAGQATMANSLPVAIASDQADVPVTLDGEQVDISDRAARDLGKVDVAGIDAVGSSAGQAVMAASFPVVIASDQSDTGVKQATHDNLNANANIQVGDVDVAVGNPVPVDVVDHVASSFDHGSNSAIGAGATRFIVASTPATLGVEVKAANSNDANVYVGNSDVTAATADATDGLELGPGESVLIRIDNVNKVYGITTSAPQRVFWLVV